MPAGVTDMSSHILGLNAFHGDSSAALLSEGQLVAAIEEERFNRHKHWAGFPVLAAKACLNGISPDHVAFSRNPHANLIDKLRWTATHPAGWHRFAARVRNSLALTRSNDHLVQSGICSLERSRVHFVEHHRAHLA